jgi:hypothetical protein
MCASPYASTFTILFFATVLALACAFAAFAMIIFKIRM